MSEFDDFDAFFEEVLEVTQRLLGTSVAAGGQLQEAEPDERVRDELLESKDLITYLLDAPGRTSDELKVSVSADEVSVTLPDFVAKKHFPSKVDPSSAKVSYNNGILSVRVTKRK